MDEVYTSKLAEEGAEEMKNMDSKLEENTSVDSLIQEDVPLDECIINVEIPKGLPPPSKRRLSATVSKDQAGCYLSYDEAHAKWVATWSPTYMQEAVAILTPSVKVPQFKYAKRERVVLECEKRISRDVKLDFLMGVCCFFKLIRDFKGDLTLLPSAEELELKEMLLVGLRSNEIVRYDKYDHTYPYQELDCVALVPKSSKSFNGCKMEQAIFMGKGCREGYALNLKNRP